jgi:protein-disulfide isomerase
MHPLAVKAGEAAECAARDGKYWPMHNRLFQEPVSLAVRDLIDAAHHVDLDTDRFQACLAGQARETVAADIALATRLHVDATPTFFIGTLNGSGVVTVTKRIDGAMPFDVFEQAIESVAHTVYQ